MARTRSVWGALFLAGWIFILITLFSITRLTDDLDLKLEEFFTHLRYRFQERPGHLEQIVIVPIDDESLRSIGLKWPWPRDIDGALLEKLKSQESDVVLMDYNFLGRSSYGEEDDASLEKSIRGHGKVILGNYFNTEGKLITSQARFQGAALGEGFINLPLERNKKIHRFWPVLENPSTKEKIGSVALLTALAYLKIDLKNLTYDPKKHLLSLSPSLQIPLDDEEKCRINYRAKTQDFRRISFIDALSHKEATSDFKNKIIIFGVEGLIFKEIHSTPLGPMSGIYILANQVLNLLNSDFTRTLLDKNILLLIAFLISLLASFLFLRLGFIRSLLCLVLFTVPSLYIEWLFYKNGYWFISSSIPLLVIVQFIALNLWKGLRLAWAARRVKQLAIHDPKTGLLTYRYFQSFIEEAWHREGMHKDQYFIFFEMDRFSDVQLFGDEEKRDLSFLEAVKTFSACFNKKDFFSARYSLYQWVTFVTGKRDKIEHHTRLFQEQLKDKPFTISSCAAQLPEGKGFSLPVILNSLREELARTPQEDAEGRFVFLEQLPESSSLNALDSGGRTTAEDWRYLETDLALRQEELEQAWKSLERIFQEKIKSEKLAAAGQLAAYFYHEINNPLTTITLCLHILEEDVKDDPEKKKLVECLVREADRMGGMSRQILSMFKFQGREKKKVNIKTFLEEILTLVSKKISTRNVKLVKNWGPEIEISIYPDQMRQVVLNLIFNALDAMSAGGTLHLGFQSDQALLEISFKDTGCGMDEETQKKIFVPFFTTKGEKGTGLGLSTCYNIVHAHNGLVEVKSKAGEGTEFIVKLPL